ncbi:chemotaxis protein CheW [Candidatus Methylospira mobilis]|uniref:Chemotaxis protein CheW n=1 Tax=Candidatus Methylospira mobilis TaxID=1808979 RepID=A0A5Q0BLA1_9GAMM|nr:chemotaxis protein CheW [Candidatus Methylospira mobilis]QFY44379.1 chemotaxis protein CheW [Candidatus Methylospira mobilis]
MTTETLEQPQDSILPEQDIRQALETNICQFVTFVVGDEVFAVDMAPVQEIIRVPEVVCVPLAPPTLEGLANLRGKVLPIISLRRIFGFPEREYDDSTRAVVIDLGQPLGFVVDRVASVVAAESGKIEDVGAISGTVNTDFLAGLLKDVGGHAMIMVLDFAKLIACEFTEIAALSRAGVNGLASTRSETAKKEEKAGDELQLVSFVVAGQEYAITIDDVQEIVQVPEHIIHVPHSEAHVLGVMTLRNRLLPLVSLRHMFALPPQDVDERSRIVVVSLGAASIGIVMDSVNEVLRVAKAHVDAMPGLFARDGESADISEICRLDEGRRLVSIISVGNMFRHSAIREVLSVVEKMQDENALNASGNPQDDGMEDDEQMVVFRLGKEEFGVPIDSVQEIVRVPDELTRVPKAPEFVEGVINLRGAVLPVIDQRLRLGLEAAERNDHQRIMVYRFDGVRTGFIVDSVTEVLKIPKNAIEASPRLSGEQARVIARIANLEKQKRIIQLIDPSRLMEGRELQGLAALTQ